MSGVQADDVVAARELIAKEKIVALFGGIDSPVALATVPVVNKEKVPYMAVWAAGTGITWVVPRTWRNPWYWVK